MLSVFLRVLRRLRRDERGVVLILFVLLFFPLMLVVAVVIDFSQTLVVKRQLTAAVDSAALALGTLPSLDDDEAEGKAEDYIRANYPDSSIGRLTGFAVTREDDTIDVSASAEVDTTFMRIAGYDTLTVTVNNRVMRKQNRLEVVMALDNTGSMGGSKMAALKDSANVLVDALFGDKTESDAVRIGLVPFAGAVNVGAALRGAAWLDEANPSALNHEQIDDDTDDTFRSLFEIFDALELPWHGCVRARAEPYELTDDPPVAGNADTLFTPYFAPDEMENNSNNYISGDAQKKKKVKHYKNKKGAITADAPNYRCPANRTVQPLTNVKSTITSAIADMSADGHTVIPEGMAWAWRLISSNAPFTTGAPYTDQDTIKVIILLTDGENWIEAPGNGEYKSLYTAFGHAADGHLGTTDGLQAHQMLNQKTTEVCTNIKADKDGDASDEDIIVYTIAFGVGGGSTVETLMRDCASDVGKFYNSPNATDLQATFESIAIGLNKLRVAY